MLPRSLKEKMEDLIHRHRDLVDKKFSVGLTIAQEKALERLREQIDALEDVELALDIMKRARAGK